MYIALARKGCIHIQQKGWWATPGWKVIFGLLYVVCRKERKGRRRGEYKCGAGCLGELSEMTHLRQRSCDFDLT